MLSFILVSLLRQFKKHCIYYLSHAPHMVEKQVGQRDRMRRFQSSR
jgi:hypothetical protein